MRSGNLGSSYSNPDGTDGRHGTNREPILTESTEWNQPSCQTWHHPLQACKDETEPTSPNRSTVPAHRTRDVLDRTTCRVSNDPE